MAVLTVAILNLFPFAVKAVFALPAETNTISSVLSICPASSLPVFIAIVYSLSRKNFVIIFITPWRPVKHFDYNFLRNAFRKVLLEQLVSCIGPSFRKVKNEIYTMHADGFYVRAKPNLCTPDITIKYISRYLGRPVIATSRIDHYDGENVTFHYTRHEDDKTVTETIPALDFIKKLIVHIPEKHFKMLRYYGIYANHHKQEKKLRKCVSAEKQRFIRSIQDWRQSILLSFGYDPLCCSKCGTSMLVLEVYHKKTALFEQYRKVMKYG